MIRVLEMYTRGPRDIGLWRHGGSLWCLCKQVVQASGACANKCFNSQGGGQKRSTKSSRPPPRPLPYSLISSLHRSLYVHVLLLKRPTMSHVQIKMELKEGAKAAASLEAGKNVGPPFAGSFKEVEGGTHAIGAK